MGEDFKPYTPARSAVSDAVLLDWLQANADNPSATIPWEYDPPYLAVVGHGEAVRYPGIVFGAEASAERGKVVNWVKVDDLKGLGDLWCGSFGGKLYLSTQAPGASAGNVADVAPANGTEACGGTLCGSNTMGIPMPLTPCPMEQRDKLLTVGGKRRGDLTWHVLLSIEVVEAASPYRTHWVNLMMVQVGSHICFRSLMIHGSGDSTASEDEQWFDKEWTDTTPADTWAAAPSIADLNAGVPCGFCRRNPRNFISNNISGLSIYEEDEENKRYRYKHNSRENITAIVSEHLDFDEPYIGCSPLWLEERGFTNYRPCFAPRAEFQTILTFHFSSGAYPVIGELRAGIIDGYLITADRGITYNWWSEDWVTYV